MCLYFRHLIKHFINTLLLVCAGTLSSAGPDSGGGGGTVLINNEPILIDFLNILKSEDISNELKNISKKLEDISKAENLTDNNISCPLAVEKRLGATNKPFSFVRYSKASCDIFALANNIFIKWETLPFDAVSSTIHGAMFSPLKWQFITKQKLPDLNTAANFYRPSNLPPRLDISAAAYYRVESNNQYIVQIEQNMWDQMSKVNQVGLVVHEALRHLQIGQMARFNDETLQKATALMVLCEPSVMLSQYLLFLISDNVNAVPQNLGSFDTLTSFCKGS